MFAKKESNIVCADGGSDINLIQYKILQNVLQEGARFHVTKFEKAKHFGSAEQNKEKGEEIFVNCEKQVVMNVERFVRHGCYLELR